MNNQNLWNFKLGSQESMDVPVWSIIGFQQRDRRISQILKNDTFCGLPITSCQCTVGTAKHPDAGILINHDDDYYGQVIGQIKARFRVLTENHLLKPYISDDVF